MNDQTDFFRIETLPVLQQVLALGKKRPYINMETWRALYLCHNTSVWEWYSSQYTVIVCFSQTIKDVYLF